MPKPSKMPYWAPNAGVPQDKLEPPDNLKDVGWSTIGEKPQRQFINWLFGIICEWLEYFSGVDYESLQKPKFGQVGKMENIGFFIGGTGNGSIIIKQVDGTDFSDTEGNRGFIWLRSPTNGKIVRGKITQNVTLSPVGAHWGAGTKGDLNSLLLRVYAINDGNTDHDFTPKWGLCLQGGFTYIRNTQDSTVASDVNNPHEVFVDSNIVNDNSPMTDVGYVMADFDDTGNVNGEDFWEFKATFPGESADGIWQFSKTIHTGFSTPPSVFPRFCMVGETVFLDYHPSTVPASVSNATTYQIELPIWAASASDFVPLTVVKDNGVTQSSPGRAQMGGFGLMSLHKNPASNAWTAAGEKAAFFSIRYEAFRP